MGNILANPVPINHIPTRHPQLNRGGSSSGGRFRCSGITMRCGFRLNGHMRSHLDDVIGRVFDGSKLVLFG